MTDKNPAKKDDTVLVVVDMQEKLFPHVVNKNEILKNINKLIEFSQLLEIPILLTEQYPKGLGDTIDEIRTSLRTYDPIEKVSFSCFGEDYFLPRLEAVGKSTLAITGIESHVCIFQTSRDALEKGYEVHVIADGISSRTNENNDIGIERMRNLGATVSSTEMFIFEMLERAGTAEFKKVAPLLKRSLG